MRLQALANPIERGMLEFHVAARLHGVGEFLERFRHGGIEHGVRVGHVHAGTRHAEFELVAREGEGARTVAVGRVALEVRQHVNAEVELLAQRMRGGFARGKRVDDARKLIAQEDRDNGRRSLVRAQAMVVSAARNAHAQQVLIIVDRFDDAGEEYDELQVRLRRVARVEQVLILGAEAPVVMLARAVNAFKRLFMLQAHEAMVAREQLHHFHGEQVLVNRAVRVAEHRGELMLARRDFVVLGFRGNREAPQLVVELFHERIHRRANGAEIMLVEFLALARGRAEQRAAAHDKVLATFVIFFGNKEVFLLGTHVDRDMSRVFAEQGKHALRLLVERGHRAQKRRLLIERLARIRAKRRGHAQHFVFDECGARGIPCGITARLKRCAQAAIGEARCIGLALNELFAREFHDCRAIAHRIEERVVLFRRDARKGLEPMREMRGAMLESPFLHAVGDGVCHIKIERLALLHGFRKLLVHVRGQIFLHNVIGEDHGSITTREVGVHAGS